MKSKKKTLKRKKKKRKRTTKEHNLLQSSLENLLLLNGRQVFLYGPVNSICARQINKQLATLDSLDSESPIILNINSGGGSITDGFSIVDSIRTTQAPVVTLVSGIAASMAGIISIAGYKRLITANAYWMGHEMACGGYDYLSKAKDRNKFYERLWDQLTEHLKKYTRLSLEDLDKLQRGELWLGAKECQEKGVADAIV